MKLILAIINNEDSAAAAAALTSQTFFVTKLSTTGGFLQVGNTTLLIGTEDEEVENVLEILKNHCKTRKRKTTPDSSYGRLMKNGSLPTEVKVGGATVFVLSVDKTEKF